MPELVLYPLPDGKYEGNNAHVPENCNVVSKEFEATWGHKNRSTCQNSRIPVPELVSLRY